MFIVRIAHVPALGKAGILRTALEEHTKASNAKGGSYGINVTMYAPETTFINSYTVENLAALDAYIGTFAADAGRQVRLDKINECLARPQSQELSEIILSSSSTEPPKYSLQVTFHLVQGKAPQLASVLKTAAERKVPGRIGAAVRTAVASASGPTITLVHLFSSLDGLEKFRVANRADPAYAAGQAQISALVTKPPAVELYRVLMARP